MGDLVYKGSKWESYLFNSSQTDPDFLDQGIRDGFPEWPSFVREMFSRCYSEQTTKLDNVAPEHKWAEKAHECAEEINEFKSLQKRCRGDELWSSIAAADISSQILGTMPKPDNMFKELEKSQQLVDGFESLQKAGIPVAQLLRDAQESLQSIQDRIEDYGDTIDPSKVRQAIRRGVSTALENIEEYNQITNAFGFGFGSQDGMGDSGSSIQEKKEIYDRVKNSQKLRQLAELAGRMRFTALRKQRSKADLARDEISDIVQGDDLARLLPTEIMKLAHPLLKKLFYKGFVEKTLLCYDLKGNEPQAKGPIIVCVDNSGSMRGECEIWSKAVALGLLEIAVKQSRKFVLHHFNTKVVKTFKWDEGKPSINDLLSAMCFFSGGGTKFKPVLEQALMDLESSELSKADVVLITDGSASTDFAEEYRTRASAKDAKTYGVLIGYGEQALKEYCDETICVQNVSSPNNATDILFSI